MATDSKTPTPSKDVDVFGKGLGLTEAERHLLDNGRDIFLRKTLQVDTHSKKGDPTEPKILVISNSRCFILSHRPPVKLEASFNFLKIQQLQCTDSKLTFTLAGDSRPREFHSTKRDSVEITSLITAQFKNVFPITPLERITRLNFDPKPLQAEVQQLRESLLSSMERLDASTIPGFITTYGFLCDFFGVPFNEEVSWYLKTVYLAHGFRELQLSDFDHLSARDLLPVLSTLRHNEFFEGVVVKDGKMSPELFDELSYVLNSSRALKKVVLRNCGLRPENLIRLTGALKNNPKGALTHLDISDNILDERAIESLGTALESLPHGLSELSLANCKILPRVGSHLANCMKQNKTMQYSLVHLNLSGNPLGPDPQGALTFLQEPNTVARLNLSKCGINFEFVIPVLNRGCQQHLRELNLSQNTARTKKGTTVSSVGSGLQQFCSSAISIATINLTDCKISSDIVVAMLEGLTVNPNVKAVDIELASNDLGQGRDPQNLATVLSRTECLHRLDMSDCGLDNHLPEFVQSVAANSAIRHLAIGKNFNGKPAVRAQSLKLLASFLSREDCHLESLCLNESRLKEQAAVVLDAMATNMSLTTVNISGNQMQNRGARCLAKALLTNCKLREVVWDHNDTTLYGFQDVANALEHNYTIRTMPLPLYDIGRAGKDPSIEEAVQKLQVFLCRNHSDERLKVELAARHRHRLLTATQQSAVVSREVVQLEDLVKLAEKIHGPSHKDVAEALEAKDQANSVVKLTDGLYSPHVEAEQFEAIQAEVRSLLGSFMEKLFKEHVQESSERMVSRSLKACPTLLSEETLRRFVVMEMGEDFLEAKKAVGHKMAPEIISRVSAINLDVAANISEFIVEHILDKLERCNSSLLKLKKAAAASGVTPEQKVSRNFTFRVQGEESPRERKKRSRKPDSDEIVLPTNPLETDGPALLHLGKTRPKPARLQRGDRKPSAKPSMPSVEEATDAPPEGQPLERSSTPQTELDKPVEKPQEKLEGKPADKLEGKPADKLEGKPADKLEEKPAEKLEEKPADKLEEKPAEKLEKPAEKPAEKLEESPAVSQPESLAEKEEKVEEKPQEQPAEEKPAEEREEKERKEEGEKTQETSRREEVQNGPVMGEEKRGSSPETKPQALSASPDIHLISSAEGNADGKEQSSPPPEEPPIKEKSPEIDTSTSEDPPSRESSRKDRKKSKKKQKEAKVVSPPVSPEPIPISKEEEKKAKAVKDRRRSGFSKLFSRSKPKAEGTEGTTDGEALESAKEPEKKIHEPPVEPKLETKDDTQVRLTPETVRKTPPPVKNKPKKAQSLDFGLMGGPEGEEEEKKVPVGTSAPMSELASVLKKGIATPLKPRPPPSEKAEGSPPVAPRQDLPTEESTPPQVAKKGPPSRPKPKPRPRVKKANTGELNIPTQEHEKVPVESSVSPEGSEVAAAPMEDQKQKGEKNPENSKVEEGGKEESGEKGKSGKEEDAGDPSLDTLV